MQNKEVAQDFTYLLVEKKNKSTGKKKRRESFYLLEELSVDKPESTLLLERAQAYLCYLHLGSCFPSSQNLIPPSSLATSCSKMAADDAWLCPSSDFCREAEAWSTAPKASCLCRTRDLSFDCLVFLLGYETEICPCLFCFLLLGGCSIIQLPLPKGGSAGLLQAQATHCCSAMKSEVPQTSRGPLGTSSFVFQWPAAAP